MQFAVLNASKRLSDTDVAFAVEACNQQAQECADAWSVPRMPVAFYSSVEGLPVRDVVTMVIVDDLDDPGALGYHTAIAGTAYGKVLAQSVQDTAVTLSHEVLEALIDRLADGWWDRGDGTKVAAEVCDPVEGDTYDEPVTIGSDAVGYETRSIRVSNYVLPRWMGASTAGKFDRMGRVKFPWQMTAGGYMVVEDAQGHESDVFARRRVRHGGPEGERNSGRKLAKADGRLLRRLRG